MLNNLRRGIERTDVWIARYSIKAKRKYWGFTYMDTDETQAVLDQAKVNSRASVHVSMPRYRLSMRQPGLRAQEGKMPVLLEALQKASLLIATGIRSGHASYFQCLKHSSCESIACTYSLLCQPVLTVWSLKCQAVVLLGGRQPEADALLKIWPSLKNGPGKALFVPEVGVLRL